MTGPSLTGQFRDYQDSNLPLGFACACCEKHFEWKDHGLGIGDKHLCVQCWFDGALWAAKNARMRKQYGLVPFEGQAVPRPPIGVPPRIHARGLPGNTACGLDDKTTLVASLLADVNCMQCRAALNDPDDDTIKKQETWHDREPLL
jgi:hypothetical protein